MLYYINMRPIFQYIDYRKYLESYYKEQKEKNRFFSYRYFAQRAGINSPSFLKWIIDGKRNLTRPVIEKFITAIKLNPKEATYFRNLVLFNQAKTSEEKQEHYAVLRSLSANVKESILAADQFDYFSKWYVPVIRELITLFDFQDDFKKIASMVKPAILPSEAKAAVKLLLKLKMIRKLDDGTYKQRDSVLVADSNVISLALQTFALSMIDHSKSALKDKNCKERHISSMTLGISSASYSLLAAELEAFKDRVKAIASRDENSNVVYQMNLALFPVSESIDSPEEMKGTADL